MVIRPKADLRHEIKFLVNRTQQRALLAAMEQQLQPDVNADGDGRYLITSLYYDTPDYKAYWDKVDGFSFRRKVRVRVYGDQPVTPESPVFLEIKARSGTRMGKRRLRLPYADAVDFGDAPLYCGCNENRSFYPSKNAGSHSEPSIDAACLSPVEQATAQELHYLFSALQLQPTCVVSYQRAAYGGHVDHPDLRVTFDTAVRGRIENLSLLATDTGAMSTILDPGWAILEVKVNQTMPFWLGELLSRHGCTPRRISKYCAVLERCRAIRRSQHIYQLG